MGFAGSVSKSNVISKSVLFKSIQRPPSVDRILLGAFAELRRVPWGFDIFIVDAGIGPAFVWNCRLLAWTYSAVGTCVSRIFQRSVRNRRTVLSGVLKPSVISGLFWASATCGALPSAVVELEKLNAYIPGVKNDILPVYGYGTVF